MKKIILTSMALLLCAGMVFAQNNDATTEIHGSGNTTFQEQLGNDNYATIQQGWLKMNDLWEQDKATAKQYQSGSFNKAIIKQRGGGGDGNDDYNWSEQWQYGDYNYAKVRIWNADNYSWQFRFR